MILVLALSLAGCHKPADDDEQIPITFNSELQAEGATRATGIALYNYQKSIKLYGTKTVSGATSVVFPDYRLQYSTTTNIWDYHDDDNDILEGQISKYWDENATQYDFVAGSPYDHTTIASDGSSVTLSGLENTTAIGSQGTISTAYLFSEAKTVAKEDFGNAVMLTFRLALCRVKVAFIFKQAQTGADGEVTLSNITFTPSDPSAYSMQGNLTVDYTKSPLEYTVTPTTAFPGSLGYSAVTIPFPGNESETYAEEIYYMIPVSSSAAASDWTMTVGSLTQNNTAIVPASYMKWEPGHQYIYKFELSDAYVDPSIKFIDCVNTAITGWTEATSSDATLYNW